MTYLIAIFVPPLYFFLRKRWLPFAVTGFLLLLSLAVWILIPVTWPVCAICAVWDLRRQLMQEHATAIATKMAEAMRRDPPRP